MKDIYELYKIMSDNVSLLFRKYTFTTLSLFHNNKYPRLGVPFIITHIDSISRQLHSHSTPVFSHP